MSILFSTFVVQIRNISQTPKKQKIMNYKEAKKIQEIAYKLDDLNNESTFVAAIQKHYYDEEYSVYLYGRDRTHNGNIRATRLAITITDISDTLVTRPVEYNAGTTIVEMVTAWEIF